MKLNELLYEREERKYSFNPKTKKVEDNLIELLKKTDDDYCYIGTADLVQNYYHQNPKSKWYIKSIFELGFPFLFHTDINNNPADESSDNFLIRNLLENQYWSLYVFTKEKPDKINIGFNEHDTLAFKYELDAEEKKYILWSLKPEEVEEKIEKFMPPEVSHRFAVNMFESFLQIDKCIETNSIPNLTQEESERLMYSFTSIPYEAFDLNYLHTLSRYKKTVVDDFGLPSKNEYIKKLFECTEFYFSDDGDYFSFDGKKGDIVCRDCVFDDYRQCFYIDFKILEKDETVVTGAFVVRSTDISPYYIWNVLMSEFNIDYSLKNINHRENDLNTVDIGDNPIFITEEIDESYYKKLYELYKQSKFSVQQKLENNKTTFYNSNAKEIILKDFNEVKDCFKAKAYKATIILAGSVLEAFLIDWLSEKDNRNYFEEDYMVFDKYRKSYRRADLVDYINTINELEKPNWMEAADKATTIRKKRNLVHAKLYINDNDISKETCTEVIDYLEYVINTRWNINN